MNILLKHWNTRISLPVSQLPVIVFPNFKLKMYEKNGEKMNNLETIFKKEEFLFPIQFESDDFKNETDIFLSLYIQDLDNLGIDQIIINQI